MAKSKKAKAHHKMCDSEMRELLGIECIVGGDVVYVARADREVGITLRYLDNDKEASCINREEILNHLTRKDRLRQYHEAFSAVVRMIQEGEVKSIRFHCSDGWRISSSVCLTYSSCAF